jgi:6-methylsalicylate decarboxylase
MPSKQQRQPTKIDVHHHIFLPQLWSKKAEHNAKVGFTTPPENIPWDMEKSLQAMRQLGIAAAVLSYPAGVPENLIENPFGYSSGGGNDNDQDDSRKKNRAAVRELNYYAQQLCNEDSKGRFGWFACLPDWRDIEGTLPLNPLYSEN